MNLYRRILTAAVLVAGSTTIAQAQVDEGQSDINLGVGFVNFIGEGDIVVPPVSLSYEYAITDEVGVGAIVGYSSTEWNPFAGIPGAPDNTISITNLMFGARGSYHYEIIDDFDTYFGLFLGYNSASIDFGEQMEDDFPPIDVGGVIYGVYAGGRYHFTDNIGAFLEVGYGISAVNLGVTFRFE